MSSIKKTYFIDLFKKFGFGLNQSEECFNTLNVDQRIFQSNLQQLIQKSPDNPQADKNLSNLKKFIESYLEEETNFHIALLPTKTISDQLTHSSNQDNLIKLLLEIKELQSDLFEWLITKILDYTNSNGDVLIMNLNINIPCYIITQFRYQPKINEPEKLCQKMVELIKSIDSVMIKKELILCFPDILSDSSPDDLITELEDLLTDTDLITVTLDTLSNLKFKNDNVLKIVNKLLDSYSIINENDLAPVIKFILKSASNLSSKLILNKLRDKLKLEEIINDTNRYLIFDIIREYFSISNQLIDLYQSQIQSDLNEQKTPLIESIDLLVFLLVYSTPQYSKQYDKLFKQVLKFEPMKNLEKSLESLFNCKTILCEIFDPLCLMAKSLIQSQHTFIYSIGQLIYRLGIESFEKKFRLNLINILVDLITSSNNQTRDNCLDIFIDLCSKTNRSNPLNSFSIQLKTLLDYIEYFSLSQIRKVYQILCNVAYSINKPISNPSVSAISSSYSNRTLENSFLTTNTIQENLQMLINKQLSSNCLKYKQIGVIGALMMIKNMSVKSRTECKDHDTSADSDSFYSCSSSQNLPTNSTTIEKSSSILLTNLSNEIKNIWEMILDSSKSSPESLGLFEDDLSSILLKDSIGDSLEILMKDNLRNMTKNLFKLDLNHRSNLSKYQVQLVSFKYGYEFGLDDHSKGALNLLPLIMNDLQKKNSFLIDNSSAKSNQLPSIAIPSTFRLMCALERKNLDDLKEYLGVPILCISKDELYKYGNHGIDTSLISMGSSHFSKFKHSLNDDERKIICNTIFLLSNWFIELINAFSPRLVYLENNDIVFKLVDRLTRVHDLQQIICNLLPHVKYYKPPMVVFGLFDSSIDDLPYVNELFKLKEVKSKSSKSVKRKKNDDKKKIIKKTKKDSLLESDFDDEKELANDTGDEIENTLLDDDNEKENLITSALDSSKISIYFRELDLSLINFVNLNLNLNPNIIPDSSKYDSSTSFLKPDLFVYVLNDFNLKLAQILKSNSSKFPSIGPTASKPNKLQQFLQLNHIDPNQLIEQLINFNLEFLYKHLQSINDHVLDIQNKNDGIRDSFEIINSKNNMNLLKCLNQILKLFNLVFTWLNSKNELKQIDKAFRKMIKEKGPELVFFNYIARLKQVILDLNTSNILVQLLDLLGNKILRNKNELYQNKSDLFCTILCTTCSELLKNDYNPKLNSLLSTRQTSNESIINMLNILIRNDPDSFKTIQNILKIIKSEDFMLDRQNCGDYNSLKNHFLAYYKVLIEYTVNELKFSDKIKFMEIDQNENLIIEIFTKIRILVEMHVELVDMKKSVSFKDINILTVIKNSKLFLTNFLKYSMPWLDKAFENYKHEVVQTFENIQKSVHFIQEILVTKDQSAIAKQAPIYMRSVEALMVRVRQLLYVNSFDGEFTVNLFESKLKIGDKPKASMKNNEKKQVDKKSCKKKGKKEESPEPQSDNGDEIEDEDEEDEEDEDDEGEE